MRGPPPKLGESPEYLHATGDESAIHIFGFSTIANKLSAWVIFSLSNSGVRGRKEFGVFLNVVPYRVLYSHKGTVDETSRYRIFLFKGRKQYPFTVRTLPGAHHLGSVNEQVYRLGV